MDAKQACDKLNGYNFQNRYLVGMFALDSAAGRSRRQVLIVLRD
jgi:pre-mRNA branch site protein p14